MTAPAPVDGPSPVPQRGLTRALLWLAGAAVFVGAVFVPQEVPLEWYPLNHPGNDINYLEIKCAADTDGWVGIFYKTDRDEPFKELNSIRFPISPTEETYTYTFPLLDAPMVALRVDPPTKGGTLKIHHLRIINRREEEVRSFHIDDFVPVQQIAAIRSWGDAGWTITSTPDATDAFTDVEPFPPIVPVDMNHRNFLRCLLSTSYLAGMLTLLMLAVVTAFWKPRSWGNFFRTVGTVAALAVPLAAIGNRGLIRNSIHYARFVPAPAVAAPVLEITVRSDLPATTQLYWDAGEGFSEAASERRGYARSPEPQVIRFQLPATPLRALRFDPDDHACTLDILRVAVSDGLSPANATEIPVASFIPANQIASVAVVDGATRIVSNPGVDDPYVNFTPDAVAGINSAATAIRAAANRAGPNLER